jgi:hypothetical protein
MAKGQIATRLHKLHEMVLTPGGTKTFGHDDPGMYVDYNDFFGQCAHYVVTNSLSELMMREDAMKSIQAVHEAGIVALPYSPMLIEFEHTPGFREFVLLKQVGEKICCHYAFLMRNDPNHPESYAIGMNYGVPIGADFGVVLPERIDFEIYSEGYLTQLHSPNVCDKEFRASLIRASTFCMNVAFLCLNMQGVEKEIITCEPLNRKRIATGRVAIPKHTSLYIGRVWKRDGTSVAFGNGHRSPRVHLRSAHTRMQAVGKGRTERKLVLIPAVLVNYKPGDELPAPPKHIVRA